MLFLLLQTFAWMLLVGLIGAMLGCLARRMFAPAEAKAATSSANATVPAAVTVATRGPVVEASKAPAPVPAPQPVSPLVATPPGAAPETALGSTPVAAPYPAVKVSVPPSSPYEYPVTTVGIPRGAPDLVQPQIQRIDINQAAAATVVATAAAVKIVTPEVAPAANYPVTTIGIPQGYPVAVTPAAAEPVAAAPPPPTTAADPARFDKALAGQVVPPPQPRPEPLRPELARDVKPAVPVADIKPAAVAPAPATPTPATPAPPASATTPTTTPAEVVAKPAPAPAAAPPAATVATTAPAPPVAKPPAAAAPAQATEAPAPAATIGAQEAAAAAAAVAATVAAAAATAAQAATTPPAASPAATVPAATAADDLTRIRAIDVDLMRRLNALGIVRFADLAKLGPVDVARLSQTLGLLGRIEQENWIEQAQILSSGADTYYSRRRQRGEIPPADPVWATRTDGNSDTPPTQSPIATAAAAAAAAAMASGAAATTAAANAATEPAKPAKLADAILSKQAEAEKPRSDLSGLRSVRSEALRPDLTTNENQRSGQPRAASQLDDLKRVRGIGVLIEKKLNSLGITTYEQIANWTNADIDRVSQILDFKGRIERENWVEQARILASGAHTEFSRRVDRGEA